MKMSKKKRDEIRKWLYAGKSYAWLSSKYGISKKDIGVLLLENIGNIYKTYGKHIYCYNPEEDYLLVQDIDKGTILWRGNLAEFKKLDSSHDFIKVIENEKKKLKKKLKEMM